MQIQNGTLSTFQNTCQHSLLNAYFPRFRDQEYEHTAWRRILVMKKHSIAGDDRVNGKIHKGEMTRRVAESVGCSNSKGEKALNAVLKSLTDALCAGNKIVLTGFGTFELTKVKARKVRPIRGANSGELIEVPAYMRVRFRPGKALSRVARE